jgi:amphi-Trp domain-containing protein
MPDVKVENKVTMTRHEAAQWLAELAEGLSGDGRVTIRLSHSTVELDVPGRLRCEAEVEVDGNEVELELELKWSPDGRVAPDGHPNGAGEA